MTEIINRDSVLAARLSYSGTAPTCTLTCSLTRDLTCDLTYDLTYDFSAAATRTPRNPARSPCHSPARHARQVARPHHRSGLRQGPPAHASQEHLHAPDMAGPPITISLFLTATGRYFRRGLPAGWAARAGLFGDAAARALHGRRACLPNGVADNRYLKISPITVDKTGICFFLFFVV